MNPHIYKVNLKKKRIPKIHILRSRCSNDKAKFYVLNEGLSFVGKARKSNFSFIVSGSETTLYLLRIIEYTTYTGNVISRYYQRHSGAPEDRYLEGGYSCIYSCFAQLISFEIDCFYSLRRRIYEYLPPPLPNY